MADEQPKTKGERQAHRVMWQSPRGDTSVSSTPNPINFEISVVDSHDQARPAQGQAHRIPPLRRGGSESISSVSFQTAARDRRLPEVKETQSESNTGSSRNRFGMLAIATAGLLVWNVMLTIMLVQRDRILQVDKDGVSVVLKRLTVLGGDLEVRRGNIILRAEENESFGVGNLVIGNGHRFDSARNSIVVGENNHIVGDSVSMLGGHNNEASGRYASVSGGSGNVASGVSSSVAGGENNRAAGDLSSIAGGFGAQVNDVHGFHAPPNSSAEEPVLMV